MRGFLITGLIVFEAANWVTGVSAQAPNQTPSASPTPASPTPLGSEADIQTLRQRAAEFWAARVSDDPDAQWKLLEPRGKGRLTAREYGAEPGGGRYLAYQVEGATVNGIFATVKVRVLVQLILPPSAAIRTPPRQVTIVDDGWIRIGGVWYRRLDQADNEAAQAKEP
jgi:hypothetical protein